MYSCRLLLCLPFFSQSINGHSIHGTIKSIELKNTSIGRTGKNWKALENCHMSCIRRLHVLYLCHGIWLSQPDLVFYLHLWWPTLLGYFMCSQEQILKYLSSFLAADEASQLPGWAVPAHRVLHPLQAHGCLRVHRVQRFRRRIALGVVWALQQAGSLSHHHVQQRSPPVGKLLFSSFFCSQSLHHCRLETAALFRDGSCTKYLISYIK